PVLTGQLIQSTYDEWLSWNGTGNCLDCHGAGDAHALKGTRDLEFLRGALELKRDGDVLVIQSRGVGHHFPTGDLFRHVTIEALRGRSWLRIANFGRIYEAQLNPRTARVSMTLISDTSLRPNRPVHVALPPDTSRVRVVYHYVSDEAEARG